MDFRSAYTYDDAESAAHATMPEGESLTKQEFKDESDINVIMRRYSEYGVVPPMNPGGQFGDFSEIGDFLECQEKVEAAAGLFAALPAKVRDRFGNDPANVIAFVMDAGNRAEAIELGLIAAPEKVELKPAEKVPEKVVAPA